MRELLYKEYKLALHPTAVLFLGLSALLFIPNYPYYVTFFYTSLGLFFICLTGRENQDIFYMMLLPVRKRDIVRARFATAVTLELLQMLTAIPFAILRNNLISTGNLTGMDANIALFGLSFFMLGLFNWSFFTQYYRDPSKVGKAFMLGCTVEFVYMMVMETLTHIVPFFRDQLDTKDPHFLPQKLIVLAIGAALYLLLTLSACSRSEKIFETLDL